MCDKNLGRQEGNMMTPADLGDNSAKTKRQKVVRKVKSPP